MAAQVQQKTYERRLSIIETSSTAVTIDNINPSLVRHFVGIRWYSDNVRTPATPTAGTALVEFMDDVTGQFTTAIQGTVDATTVSDKAHYTGSVTSVRITPTGVTGASHYEVVISSHSEGSTDLASTIETSDRGNTGVAVFLQDQTTPTVDMPLMQILNEVANTSDSVRGTNTIEVASGHGAVAGNTICIANTTTSYMYAGVLSVTATEITIDSPLNHTYSSGSTVVIGNTNLVVDGSVTPVIFKPYIPVVLKLDITRLTFTFRGSAEPDFSTFGNDSELTKGCVLRRKKSNGDYNHMLNFKSNNDLILNSFDIEQLTPKATGNTTFGLAMRISFAGQENHGVAVRLDGSIDEALEVLVQDNLTGGDTDTFRVLVQGGEVQDRVPV